MMSENKSSALNAGPGFPSERANLSGYLMLSSLQWLRRSRSLRVFRNISLKPLASAEQVRADQFRRLHDLLEHAVARVPYYRELFTELGISITDIRGVEDLSLLPVLTKDIVRDRWRELIREDVPLESLSKHHSGGSTGVPLTFYRDRAYMDASEAGTFRNYYQSGWRPGDMVAFFWGSNERIQQMSRARFELRQRVRRMYQFDPFRSGPADMDEWLRVWPSLNARIAQGYASTIARFADHVEQSGKTIEPLRGVFTTAEKLFPQQRETIARVFNCHVFDCYGSSEVQNIAAECRNGRMHVNADFVVLEVDRSANDQSGSRPFLVTSLWNYSMPFIRYRNEDCGALVDDTCDCGNNFPLMELNIARVSDNFRFPDGRVVHGEFFTHLMYGSEGIINFQFHQTAPDNIRIWIVPGEGNADKRDTATRIAVDQIKALTTSAITVEVRETDKIPLSSAGKHSFTRSDVGLESRGDS